MANRRCGCSVEGDRTGKQPRGRADNLLVPIKVCSPCSEVRQSMPPWLLRHMSPMASRADSIR